MVLVWLVISGLYLFHLIVLLNPDFDCSEKLLSSSVDKVTNRTYHFVPVILNAAFVGLSTAATAGFPPYAGTASLVALLVNTHFSGHVKIRLISQLIDVISSVLQRLLNYFNGTMISASFVVLIPSNFAVILVF